VAGESDRATECLLQLGVGELRLEPHRPAAAACVLAADLGAELGAITHEAGEPAATSGSTRRDF